VFFLSCKANATVKLATTKTGHGPHSSTLVVFCVVHLLFLLFCVLFVCKCVLPPGDNPITVNKCMYTYLSIGFFLLLMNSLCVFADAITALSLAWDDRFRSSNVHSSSLDFPLFIVIKS
jgi:hypothetical protein